MKKKTLFLKRRSIDASQTLVKRLKAFVSGFARLTLAKRRILFVTNEKIRTVTVGPVAQLSILLVLALFCNLFYQSLQYNKIISAKSEEIARLKDVNNYFDTEFSNIDDRLQKVNDYLISVTGKNILASDEQDESFKLPKNLGEKKLLKSEKKTAKKIKNAVKKMSSIKQIAHNRIKKIEKAIAITGLNFKKPPKDMAHLIKKYPKLEDAVGGPYIPLENYSASEAEIQNISYNNLVDTAKFVDSVDRLIVLEKLTKFIPLTRPIEHYYISSGFGARTDPMTKKMAMHQGLDFVGPLNETILSPSSGTVILAGKFYDYGNAVVIDHGFGITTRYGHLSEVLVKKGQIVKQGDKIAKQGSTGRSTGQHLHYEVRYNNKPLNPRKFIEAGDWFLNTKTPATHANS